MSAMLDLVRSVAALTVNYAILVAHEVLDRLEGDPVVPHWETVHDIIDTEEL